MSWLPGKCRHRQCFLAGTSQRHLSSGCRSCSSWKTGEQEVARHCNDLRGSFFLGFWLGFTSTRAISFCIQLLDFNIILLEILKEKLNDFTKIKIKEITKIPQGEGRVTETKSDCWKFNGEKRTNFNFTFPAGSLLACSHAMNKFFSSRQHTVCSEILSYRILGSQVPLQWGRTRRLVKAAAPGTVLPWNAVLFSTVQLPVGFKGPFPSRREFFLMQKVSHSRNQGVWERQFRRTVSVQADLLFGTWNKVSKLSHFSKGLKMNIHRMRKL